MFLVSVRVFVAACFTLCDYFEAVYAGSVLLNSNAIKNLPAGVNNPSQASQASQAVSATPDLLSFDSGSQNTAIDTSQTLSCADDDECSVDEFCNESRGTCIPCRKKRKRCARDAMCCPGNHCSNVTLTSPSQPELIAQWSFLSSKLPKRCLDRLKSGQEGENCLRSTDCAEGLCCARHFWSRICKPVLTEGQVCSKQKRKGTRGLEIFERCACGDGLACRPQRGHQTSKSARSLNTCQRR
ncbi:dickkopf-related protein 1-like [Megalops cyprinoides]|uniref:dickkopf-related protein 1-like n=1 Tax=Megalops cyprinoides TaxID=118141 RepID=UPI0018655063|nr:dickkopf-related protein 1-like [Megalops cyprinoides]